MIQGVFLMNGLTSYVITLLFVTLKTGGGMLYNPIQNHRFSGEISSLQGLPARDQSCTEGRYIREYPCGFQNVTAVREFSFYKTCVHLVSEKKTGFDAEAHCRGLKGHLVYIPGLHFDRLLTNFLRGWRAENAWIGLRHLGFGWKWIVNKRPMKYTYFNSNPSKINVDACALKSGDTEGRWLGVDCKDPHPFVCQRESMRNAGSASLRLPRRAGKLEEGGTLQATCTVIGDTAETVLFHITTGYNKKNEIDLKMYSTNDSHVSIKSAEFLVYNGVCMKSREATLELVVTFSHYARKLECCGYVPNGSSVCSRSNTIIELTIKPAKPKLAIDYEGDALLMATCKARIKIQGQMAWVVASPQTAWTWNVHVEYGTIGDKVDGVSVASVPTDDLQRNYIFTAQMNITLTRKFEGFTIACFSRDPKDKSYQGFLTDDPLRSNLHLIPNFQSEPPTLSQRRKELGNTTTVTVTCDAFVSGSGVLTWYFSLKDTSATWKINDELLTVERVPESVDIEHINASTSYDWQRGARIVSSIYFVLDKVLARNSRVTVACFSYNSSSPGDQVKNVDRLMKIITIDSSGHSYTNQTIDASGYYTANPLVLFMWLPIPVGLLFLIAATLNAPKARTVEYAEATPDDFFETESTEADSIATTTFTSGMYSSPVTSAYSRSESRSTSL